MKDANIYIADQRGEIRLESGVVRSTLNYEGYVSPYRLPVATLQHVNEWQVQAEYGTTLFAKAGTVTLLIPLVDGLSVLVDKQQHRILIGRVFVWKAVDDIAIHIQALEGVHGMLVFQHIVFSEAVNTENSGTQYSLPIVSPEAKNNMLAVLADSSLPFQLYVGAFLGKSEFLLNGTGACRHFFALPLDGTFEVEERLLFSGDALRLSDQRDLAIECLSSTGILLVLDF